VLLAFHAEGIIFLVIDEWMYGEKVFFIYFRSQKFPKEENSMIDFFDDMTMSTSYFLKKNFHVEARGCGTT
jgi:hypothetical protein